jgi:gliding motility-associated lipoprotein GldB
MNNIRTILFASILTLTLLSCTDNNRVDVTSIDINTKLVRFDSLFFSADANSLINLKIEYPLMFPEEYPDSVWLNKISDKHEQEVYQKSVKVFGDFHYQYDEVVDVFKHLKYYFPKFISPEVFTILSDFDYQYPVLYSGKRLFISLDMYLGVDEVEYNQFPNYFTKNMHAERIKVDVADAILRTIVSNDPYDKTLLAQMIYNGKLLYLSQILIPNADESLIIGYSKDESKWCKKNETDIWTYIVKNKYLYNTDPRLTQRFIDVAPFTKFFLDLDRDSPGRVGIWLGRQIVNSYMENNDISIEELVKNNDAKDIFIKSKYKPKK